MAFPVYNDMTESSLWKRLASGDDSEVRDLATKVERAARGFVPVLERIVEYMPLYTVHGERHILNVIGWIERLLGKEGVQRMSPLECALASISSYAHDLGMSLTRREHRDIMD